MNITEINNKIKELKANIKDIKEELNKTDLHIETVEFLNDCISDKEKEIQKLNNNIETVKNIFAHLDNNGMVNLNGTFIEKVNNKYVWEYRGFGEDIKENTTKVKILKELENNNFEYELI